ncbi:methionine--tRNA ligase mes1 [Spiromyces aspiralis]|uniref:Methionine--tRNA ligase mes1 n=1 Tax=Spiromyces aspiralis TaxID=68401 RepID=A0ACC1HFZ2_9FUNG|nr:methionine--tRNA ligase mes1 [Spiromyces aspiralis]
MTNSPIVIQLAAKAPATNTAAASGLLKVLLAAAYNDVAVQFTTPDTSAPKSKVSFRVQFGSGLELIEPNAAVRYIFRSFAGPLTQRMALEAAFEWEDRVLAPLALNKDTPVATLFAEVEGKLEGQGGSFASLDADVAVFATLYHVVSRVDPKELRAFSALSKWYSIISDNCKTASAIEQYKQYTTPVVIRQAPTPENRKIATDVAFEFDPAKVVLPVPGKKNILITSALPYVNNVPHLGNIIGSVLSADVFARYARARNLNTLYICGTDEYGTATETKALEEGVSCQELCDKYNALHREVYEWFNISFNYFGRTTTSKQTEIVQEIFLKCHKNGYTIEQSLTQLYCEKCERFLADRYVEGTCPKCGYDDARGDQCDKCGTLINAADLIDPRCKLDSNRPVLRESNHLFIDLEKLQRKCEEFVERSSVEGKWSPNGIQITNSWLKEGLKPRCITRDLKWGVPVPLESMKDKVFYVWFDACIGYPSITANYTKEWRQWWQNPEHVRLYQFMGKDNVPFHTVVFPSVEIATGDRYTLLHHISTTEYLNYEDGKFSKSRGVGVFGNNAKDTGVPPDVWRYYLLSNRPESSDTVFTWSDFVSRNNNELLANIGNLVNRITKFLDSTDKYGGVLPPADPARIAPGAQTADRAFIDDVNALLARYIETMDNVHLRAGLRIAMELSARGNQYLQESKLDNTLFTEHRSVCDTVVNLTANFVYLLSAVFHPYIPATSQSIAQQLNAPECFITDTFKLVLLPGHVIGKPKYLFTPISEKQEAGWRSKFGGKQVQAEAETGATAKPSKKQQKQQKQKNGEQ